MPYSAIDFTAFQTLTAAQMDTLAANDASFNDGTGIGDDAIQSRHIDWANTGGGDNGGIWWEELGRTTLGSAGDTISLTPIAARKYLKIYVDVTATGGAISALVQFNGDSGSNYATRRSLSGAADTTTGSASSMITSSTTSTKFFIELEVENVATQEKLGHYRLNDQSTAGAANVPNRIEGIGKWANTTNQITRVDVVNNQAGDFAIGSQLIVLGHD